MTDIIKRIKKDHNILCLKGADSKDIEAAEKKLSVTFSEEYKEYTKEFGAISVEEKQITGVYPDPDLDVISITEFARNITPEADPSWYVVYDAHIDGLLYWQDPDGKVYRTFPGESPSKVANSLVEFLQL